MYRLFKDIEKIVADNPDLEDLARQLLKDSKDKLLQTVKDSDKYGVSHIKNNKR